MNMTKEQALEQIEELRKYVEQCDKPKKLKVTNTDQVVDDVKEVYINGHWAYSTFDVERGGVGYEGCEKSGHDAMLHLSQYSGTWYDEAGNEIKGYLFFNPKGE